MAHAPPAGEGSVAVVVRVRPQTPREREANRQSVVQVVGDCMLVFDPEEPSPPGVFAQAQDPPSKRKGKNLTFAFDRVFGESATQAEVFENTTKEILDGVLNGYNCSVFAYGATGAGKTHTMLGSEKEPGIMYFTMEELYKQIEARKEEKHCEVLVSYQEVYNEQIHDLLEPKGPLAIQEDPEKGVVVQGLSYHQPKSAGQLLEMLRRGNLNRTQHPTDINATSSRSHAVFQIHVKQRDRVVGISRDLRVAKMSLIDLAGSERASATKGKGERRREGANINRSLLALINVINSLADAKGKKPHIPYRDSKLTRLLKDSIGGNCRTIMIAAVSPSALSYEDTYNTLKYANRAKEIKLLMKSNVVSVDCHISQYAAVCEQLKAEVAELRGRLRAYEENVPEVRPHLVPPVLTPSRPGQDEFLRSKEACSDYEAPDKGDGKTELSKPNDGASRSGKSSTAEQIRELGGNSSFCATESSDPAEKQEKLNAGLQGMDKKQLIRLVMSILHVAQRQYALLKAANLLTPDTRVDFEDLGSLVSGEACEAPDVSALKEQVGELDAATRGSLEPEGQQPVDNAALLPSLPAAECADPTGGPGVLSASPERGPMPSAAFKTPHLPTKKRRKSAESPPLSERSSPSSPKGRAKRRRKTRLSPQQVGSLKEWAAAFPQADGTSTPVVDKARSSSPYSLRPLPCCPLTVTKTRRPLATSAAQNCSTPAPPRGLNTTFDLCEVPCPPDVKSSASECPAWESVQQLSNHQGAPFIPSSRLSMPVFTMKGSSIPRSSSLASKTTTQKRRHTTNPATYSLGAPRSRIARLQGTSLKSSRVTSAPGQPSGIPAWKWR
ncbi:kinesin-like protein KIF18B [Zootoca vivipara]|uniref:kinesin-like protein KIF18B n=1 Tax=Zootoca vivipara TaxID=8524 RepID=UPI00293BD3DB|nr:kinesin-like protein KIF18B [Zootoca vivipara]